LYLLLSFVSKDEGKEQGKARQERTGHDQTKQEKGRHDRTGQGKTGQDDNLKNRFLMGINPMGHEEMKNAYCA
jgi:hypothetical protein